MSIIEKKEKNLNELLDKLNALTSTYSHSNYDTQKIVTEKNDLLRQKSEIEKKNSELLSEYLSNKRKFNYLNLDLLEIFYKAKSEKNQKIIDSVNTEIENLIKRKYLYSLNFAINNSGYEISPYIAVSEIADANTDLLNKLYDTLPENIKNSKYGKILGELVKY